jgi:hypothetical protein
MDIYKFINLDNGDILLEKIFIDKDYIIIIEQDNGNKLLKKIININDYNFTKSQILECFINNKEYHKLKYRFILNEIYNIINDGVKIIKNTKINIKTLKKENEGFYYLHNIGISVQGIDSNKCLLEILNQCIENNIKIILKIKLINNNIINLNLNF